MAAPPQQQCLLPTPPAPAPAGSSGRRRHGRRGGRRRGKQPTDAGVAVPKQPPCPPPPTGAPPIPRFLSTHSTLEKNDPLWNTTGVTVAAAEFHPIREFKYVYSGADALSQIVLSLHASYVSASPVYTMRVPESALGYYAAVLTWHRLLSLHRGNGLYLSWDEEQFVKQVSTLNLEAPLLLAHYLAGFGNTRSPSGMDFLFRLRDRPPYVAAGNVPGWFGPVSYQTLPLYRDYPCLAVYAARVQASLAGGDDRDWSFPDEIVKSQSSLLEGSTRLSTSCVGYGPRERLSTSQVDFLNRCEVYASEAFMSVNPAMPVNLALLLAIRHELCHVSSLKLSPLPTLLSGSQIFSATSPYLSPSGNC